MGDNDITFVDEEPEPISSEELKVMKWDISALIKVIEEIEKRLKMEQILDKKKQEKKTERIQPEDEEEEQSKMSAMDKLIKQQFSMLNFNRNFLAIKYAQSHPTDERNKITI